MRIGGAADTSALLGVAGSVLSTSPFFASIPSLIPIAIGAAGSCWLGSRALERVRNKNILGSDFNLETTDVMGDQRGLHLGYDMKTGRPIYQPLSASNLHALVQGGSGQGKTVLLKNLAFQQIQRGGGLFFIDPKLDADDLRDIYAYAVQCGRAHDLLVIDPSNPKHSHTYNPILYGDPDENADSVLSLIPASEDKPGPDHYRQAAKQALATIFGSLKALGLAYNFIDISTLVQNQYALNELERRMKRQIPNAHETKNLIIFLEQFRGNDKQIDVKKLKDMLGGIGSRMHTFGTGGFGEVANSYSPQVRLYEAIRANKIIILRLPTMGKRDTAYAFAKMALADFRIAVSWLQKLPKHLRPSPAFLGLFDEAGSFATQTLDQLLEQGRTAGISLWLFLQSYHQLEKVSPEFKEIVLATTSLKIFFNTLSAKDKEESAEIMGEDDHLTYSLNHTSRTSTNAPKTAVAPDGGNSTDIGLSIVESLEQDFRIRPREIGRLEKGEALMLLEGEHLVAAQTPYIQPNQELLNEVGNVELHYFRTPTRTGCDFFENAIQYTAEGMANRAPGNRSNKGL